MATENFGYFLDMTKTSYLISVRYFYRNKCQEPARSLTSAAKSKIQAQDVIRLIKRSPESLRRLSGKQQTRTLLVGVLNIVTKVFHLITKSSNIMVVVLLLITAMPSTNSTSNTTHFVCNLSTLEVSE